MGSLTRFVTVMYLPKSIKHYVGTLHEEMSQPTLFTHFRRMTCNYDTCKSTLHKHRTSLSKQRFLRRIVPVTTKSLALCI